MRTALRHCMVVHAYYPLGETLVQRQAETLVAHRCEVDVICLRLPGEPETETVNGVAIYRLPVRRGRDKRFSRQLQEYLAFFARATVRLARLHRSRRYHVVQVHHLPDFLAFSALVPKLSGAGLLLQLRDLMPEFFAARSGRSMNDPLVRLVLLQERVSCAFADHVITVTEAWRETLIRRGLPPAKCSVVMNLADPRYFRPAPSVPTRRDPGLHVIYHGSLTFRYGIDLLLRAVARVRDDVPGLHVTVLGDGEALDALVELAAELQVDDIVRFSRRFLPVEDLVDVLHTADVGVVPNRRDPFTDTLLPTKLLEYAALGMPAIVARTTGIAAHFDASMVEFFQADDVDDLAMRLRLLYADPARRRRLGERIQAFNQEYNWPTQAQAYVKLVESLAGTSAR